MESNNERSKFFADYLELRDKTQIVRSNPVTYKLTIVDHSGESEDMYFHDWQYMMKRLNEMMASIQHDSVLECNKRFSIEVIVGHRARTEDDGELFLKRNKLKRFLINEGSSEDELKYLNAPLVKSLF